ncbi:MAG: Notchless-like WD40 repeat-containing protein [Amphiamblys sp. WSBS2006]|nr:MAG: Notchless-like WD40 repeat-containing protein [Amphiamblys sp. WSBS2006]
MEKKILLQLWREDGEQIGHQMAVSLGITTEHLDRLVQHIEKTHETVKYIYEVDRNEIDGLLDEAFLKQIGSTGEQILSVVCRPQTVAYTCPVTRCTGAIPGHSEAILCVSFSPDGRGLASGGGDGSVRFWDLTTNTPKTKSTEHSKWVLCLRWSPDSRYVVSGGMDSAVVVWDGASGVSLGNKMAKHSKWVSSAAWEPSTPSGGQRRFATGSGDGSVKVWGLSGVLFSFVQHTDSVTCVKWSRRGVVFSASRDRTVRGWCPEKRVQLFVLSSHAHWINTISLSSESPGQETEDTPDRVVSASDDTTLALWVPEKDTKPVCRMTGHQGVVCDAKFSPDGKLVVSASFDKSIMLWNGFTGERLFRFFGHVGPVYQLSWAPDSRLFASGSKDSTLKVWNTSSRKLSSELPGHSDAVYTVDWSCSGAVCSGGKDKLLRLWKA